MIIEQKSSSSSSSSQKPKTFPIPNLKGVFQCYDVPEPMIHPPGSDSATFMKPNPNKGKPFTPISPMDIDPCIVEATCCEIFSKTTDLTASEHAGVTLSEHTTMVSTATSDSSDHLEALAQKTVANHLDDKLKPISPLDVGFRVAAETVKEAVGNSVVSDAVATNIESNVVVNGGGVAAAVKTENDVVIYEAENGVVATNSKSQSARFIVCDVCNITLNSEKAVMVHTKGKAHLKKSKKLQVSSIKQEPPSPDSSNGILDQQSEETKNQNLLQKEASVGSLFFCSIPDLDCVNQKIQSIATEEVTVPLCMDQVLNSTLLSTTPLQPANGSAQNTSNKLKIHQTIWCEACKANCGSNKCIERHDSGKQDPKSLEDLEKNMSPSSTASIVSTQSTPIYKPVEDLKSTENNIQRSNGRIVKWCEVCKVSCTGDDIKKHLLGKKHLKNLQKPVNSVESLQLPKCDSANPNEGNTKWCEICQICCSSNEAFQKHISGKKHTKNLMKSRSHIGLGPAPSLTSKPLHDHPNTEESKAFILESCKRKTNGSSADDEDVNTKRQKGATITCNVCKVVCNNTMGFIAHLASQEHSAMALKQASVLMK